MKSRSQKKQIVQDLNHVFHSSTAGFLVDCCGLNAQEMVSLRQQLHQVKASIKIVKNTLARLAAQETPFAQFIENFIRTRALAYSQSEPIGIAKVLTEFAKKNKKLKIHASILNDNGKLSYLSEVEIFQLAQMPSKEELMVKILFLLQAPTTQLVRTLNEVPAQLVRTLSAIVESQS